ncbi:MAG: glycosyl transferase, group 1 [uncultured bacterium]|nr:MAG: glycosyl transferase, group 1 [uncultured bacterium]KKU26457.1 MAG: Glycosyl transferase, group 1 [Microgenomates group bacterium GW2011_GWA2_46_16]
MKIVFLHMTMGLVNRGSEISTDLLARSLSKNLEVLVIQSGPITQKPYTVKRVYPLQSAPSPAPTTLVQKSRSRLYIDDASLKIKQFTIAALPSIHHFGPNIIVATNGLPQLRILQGQTLQAKVVVFGRAGIGYHDADNLAAQPDLFIALSSAAETWANHRKKDLTRVVMIPNPLDIASFQKLKKINLGLKGPIVMTVGALSNYKNIHKVIEATYQIQASLLLVGDGEEHSHISSLLSKMSNNFRWIKHLEPEELSSYYLSVDAFCFIPGAQEAFGRVYLEAMAAGLPIVASDDPIRRSIVGRQGIYVNPQNISQVIRGINLALTKGKINYAKELVPYQPETILAQLTKEFHALIE